VFTAALPYQWHIQTVVEGQITTDALVAPVQFGVGGVDSVRGFDERAITDDRGVRGSVQFESPDQGAAWLGENWQLHGVTFYDAASLDRNDPLPGEINHIFISSAGVGLRLARTNQASVRLDLAEVINGADIRPRHSMMLHASAIYTF
jgi:hemolysin activation/secretion protein